MSTKLPAEVKDAFSSLVGKTITRCTFVEGFGVRRVTLHYAHGEVSLNFGPMTLVDASEGKVTEVSLTPESCK